MTITSAALMAARSSTATGGLSDAGQGKTLQRRATVLMVGLTVTKQTVGVLAATGLTDPASTTPGGTLLRGTRSTNTSTFMRNRGRRRPARETKVGSRNERTLRNDHALVMNDVRRATIRAPVDTRSRCLLAGSRSITDAPARLITPRAAAARPRRATRPPQIEDAAGFHPARTVYVDGVGPDGDAN